MWLYLAALVGLYYLVRWYWERQVVSHLRDKYVLITGCGSGFGNLLARQLDMHGLRVLAACRTEKAAEQLRAQSSDRLETVTLDIAKTESITAATQWVKERVGDRDFKLLTAKLLATCKKNLSEVTDCMEHALTACHPHTCYLAGWDAKLFYLPMSYMPTFLADAILTRGLPRPAKAL
ncbi:retinol dehydrogenase 7-like [Lemur catta]|uniref:retinol dehydrogenase 7-like n=1 Tax=Lemur catta TaxID=9447 RepID=UPI001E267075|nr:retinol dehydrogenase 7-like [Lemur catta]